jgi:hypothetical protein
MKQLVVKIKISQSEINIKILKRCSKFKIKFKFCTITTANRVGRSFENCSFKFLSKTGQQMDWGPQGFTFSTFYCFPNLT